MFGGGWLGGMGGWSGWMNGWMDGWSGWAAIQVSLDPPPILGGSPSPSPPPPNLGYSFVS